jgi:hypothetical protein
VKAIGGATLDKLSELFTTMTGWLLEAMSSIHSQLNLQIGDSLARFSLVSHLLHPVVL